VSHVPLPTKITTVAPLSEVCEHLLPVLAHHPPAPKTRFKDLIILYLVPRADVRWRSLIDSDTSLKRVFHVAVEERVV